MTDCSKVQNELMILLDFSQEDIEKYDSLIDYAVNCVKPLIKSESDENDVRIIHLCAIKAYYQIVLLQDEGVNSFSAGEVSYSVDTSTVSNIKLLLKDALLDCKDLINISDFAFEVV
jgi:hypothetical protein